MDRLLRENDVLTAFHNHINDNGELDNSIKCILEDIETASIDLPHMVVNKLENKQVQKEKRIQLFENDNLILEQRGNKYYLSLYDTIGRFKKEVTIDMKYGILEILSREDCYENI